MKISETEIKKILAKILKIKISKITDDFSMTSYPKWDSLNHLKLIIALEGKIGVSFKEKEVTQITSYKLIKLYLKKMGLKIL
ncbi:MAG: acyl carrier protein [Flammeovirgaceae bacterium]|nr:acyl carrier protein [Flammeovirgaceae bacterium]|tara:strand:+ start:587 stop:832 length:246 start_codon:yes stop_codon:yes gene_type:complete